MNFTFHQTQVSTDGGETAIINTPFRSLLGRHLAADVGVVEGRSSTCFAAKALKRLGLSGYAFRKGLQAYKSS
jgi:hypothetical protein